MPNTVDKLFWIFLLLDEVSCQIEAYVNQHLPKVKVVRTPERQGLIRARVYGAHHAKGEVSMYWCWLLQNRPCLSGDPSSVHAWHFIPIKNARIHILNRTWCAQKQIK